MEKPLIVSCLSPRVISDAKGRKRIVSCGKCEACLNKKASRNQRLCELEQLGAYSYCYFVTLTYTDEHIPRMELVPSDEPNEFYLLDKCPRSEKYNVMSDETYKVSPLELSIINKKVTLEKNTFGYLLYRDIQLFHKRLRKQIKSEYNEDVRFFVVGEYGPTTLRPHWHAIYFTRSPLCERGKTKIFSKKNIYSLWKKGRVDSDRTNGGANSYTASYINSGAILPSIYQDAKISVSTRHSVRLGHEALHKFFCNKIDEALFKEETRRLEISASYVVNGCVKRLPLDATYKNRYFCKPYRFNCIAFDKSLVPYVRAYYHYRKFFGAVTESVKQLTEYVFEYFLNTAYSVQTEYDRTFFELLDLNFFDAMVSEDSYITMFNRLYRFMLYSRRFGSLDFESIVTFYDCLDYSNLCQQYERQSEYVDRYGYTEDFEHLFYDNYFSLELLKQTIEYKVNEKNQECIHQKKLLRKKMNDLANVLYHPK